MLSKLFQHNWFAILYVNFKLLPLSQAIRLPIDIYGKVRFINLSGTFIIAASNIKRGMIKIGSQGSDMFGDTGTTMDILGKIKIIGSKAVFGRNGLIRVEKEGEVEIHDGVVLGANFILFCENSIKIYDNTITSWNCQIMDTDTHSILDLESNLVKTRSKAIVIRENCWIGNNVIINKGTILPKRTIVASFSLCNRDYSKYIDEYSIIAGNTARLITRNKKMIGDKI